MKKITVSAYSLEEAKVKAKEMGLSVSANVTQSWKNQNCPMDKEFTDFATTMLSKKGLAEAEGVGLIVAVNPGSKDTRERPYKYRNNRVEGKRQNKRVIQICLNSTNEVIGTADNKGQAEKLAKKLMSEYREGMYAKVVYEVTDGKEIAFYLDYAPSTSAKEGKYIVFGNERS